MRQFIIVLLITFSIPLYSLSIPNLRSFNKLVEIEGTVYVIATIENRGKSFESNETYLLFINTLDGSTNQLDFHKDANIYEIEQIKIDSLEINNIVVLAKNIALNLKKGIDWGDPFQIYVLSTDGKEKIQLTEDRFFVKKRVVNNKTGRIIITGNYDTNNNNKYDKTDKSEIRIYYLKTLKLISRM